MNIEATAPDPIAMLDQQLQGGRDRLNFDMDDKPELPWLKPFPRLHAAIGWLDENVTTRWSQADKAAMKHQVRHQWLARTAVATGVGAIIMAVVLLALKQSWPGFVAAAVWIEGFTVLAGFVSVGMGLWAKSDLKWLGCRHRAELLRMLKFRALARTELWCGQDAQWRSWVENEIAALPDLNRLEPLEEWSSEDTSEAEAPAAGIFSTDQITGQALAIYYRHKRLLNQAEYFERKGNQAGKSLAGKLRHQREHLFFLTIGFVLFHFAADSLSLQMEPPHLAGAAQAWELASLWSIVLAVVLPVLGIGVRAWSAAFELSRKARSFAAKHRAMQKAADRLENGQDEFPVILAHLRLNELFLEQEHREWLRLLLDAEWFL